MKLRSVCVFCGSRDGNNPEFKARAIRFGERLAEENIRLVYGGGTTGMMGAVALGVLSKGGMVTGIIPDFLLSHERAFKTKDELDEVIITKNMHERKMLMYEKSDAFVALPGGIGTLEEFVEQMTWAQLGQHKKPILLANFAGFWTPFFDLIQHMINEDFIGGKFPTSYLSADHETEILDKLQRAVAETEIDAEVDAEIKAQM